MLQPAEGLMNVLKKRITRLDSNTTFHESGNPVQGNLDFWKMADLTALQLADNGDFFPF